MRIKDKNEQSIRLDGKGKRFAVVVARFNSAVTEDLLHHCLITLGSHGVLPGQVQVVRVPGAFELPWAAQKLALTKRYHAVITLGCIIRGRTPHDRYIAQAVAQGVMRVSLDTGVPVLFGVLTTLNEKQARALATRNTLLLLIWASDGKHAKRRCKYSISWM